ncbi:MAG: single-stranded DNA-binding protein [bacterium]|jgi:single-strand DNA-binding protein
MLNKVILIGRITADPELRYTQSGIAVASYSIAVDRRFKGPNGEKQTDFINVVSWRKQAELLCNYVKKGYMIAVEGSLHMRKYQAQDGQNRTVYEVVTDNVQFLDRGGRSGGGEYAPAPADEDVPQSLDASYNPPGDAPGIPEEEDDLPF